MTHEPDPTDPGPDLSDAVEDALRPAKHDAVMAVWQQVVLGRLDRDRPRPEEDEALRRLYERDRPGDDPPGDAPGGPSGDAPGGPSPE
ncbi:hypothetical protein [Actinomycetospora sp. NBRC 106378]|uniref:hypothetical protein n=1 Tax=Actinomycetospora sp. NBRC 106378 TaxID=3032208 RepID=UPI0024A19157|nr:hypothetical protein [Actinomycetospora sp. NBRC 106378]GLZ55683.1 hypothetical protein Acsp07_53000 [Actinomycetospora sp. NBRC 106378]